MSQIGCPKSRQAQKATGSRTSRPRNHIWGSRVDAAIINPGDDPNVRPSLHRSEVFRPPQADRPRCPASACGDRRWFRRDVGLGGGHCRHCRRDRIDDWLPPDGFRIRVEPAGQSADHDRCCSARTHSGNAVAGASGGPASSADRTAGPDTSRSACADRHSALTSDQAAAHQRPSANAEAPASAFVFLIREASKHYTYHRPVRGQNSGSSSFSTNSVVTTPPRFGSTGNPFRRSRPEIARGRCSDWRAKAEIILPTVVFRSAANFFTAARTSSSILSVVRIFTPAGCRASSPASRPSFHAAWRARASVAAAWRAA